jgi:hypothetical protein
MGGVSGDNQASWQLSVSVERRMNMRWGNGRLRSRRSQSHVQQQYRSNCRGCTRLSSLNKAVVSRIERNEAVALVGIIEAARQAKKRKSAMTGADKREAKSKLFGQSGAEEACENMEKTQRAGRAQNQSVLDTISTNPVPDKVGRALISVAARDREKHSGLASVPEVGAIAAIQDVRA